METTFRDFIGQVMFVLNYKLFELDGNGISLGKLLSGVLLLVVGYLISKRASREVERRVLVHMPLEPSMRYTLRQLIFYFMLFITTLFTLRALNVPITIFTVIGGALAVGIGFGSQNLVNNFISGLLVMAERPMRIGDFIEVDGISGSVENIGIRSTTIRTLQNVMIVIPNTVFIEKNLTNWTLSGTVPSVVRIGVAYDTDLDKMQAACRAAIRDVNRYLEEPHPAINFVDYGDSSLVFDIGMALPAHEFPNRKVIESEFRFKLFKRFAEVGVQIPFPVRDVHMKIGAPVPVKILN
jgi:potassium-dependent mechanosensitive channel